MPAAFQDVFDAALMLPDEDRAELTRQLLDTFGTEPNAEVMREWIAVSRERLERVRRGETKTIPADEVFAEIRERLKRPDQHEDRK